MILGAGAQEGHNFTIYSCITLIRVIVETPNEISTKTDSSGYLNWFEASRNSNMSFYYDKLKSSFKFSIILVIRSSANAVSNSTKKLSNPYSN